MAGIDDLTEALGAPPPPGLAATLTDAEAARLARAVRAAKTKQARALDEATTAALDHVPRLLRGPIRKLVLR
jgi:hypothetical protein